MTKKPVKRRSTRSTARQRTPGARRAVRAKQPAKRDPADDLTPDVRAILDSFVLHNIVSHLLRRAHFAAEELFAREFSDEQITPRQKATLIAVYQRPGVSQKMLAEHLFMDRVTVAEMVNRLVARRLIERRPSAEDQRAYELFLAADGAAMLNRVMPRDASVERAILRPLSKEDEELFKRCLRLVVRGSQS
jgi:DNA-binding MarR family transcriptional regulator